MPEQEGILRAPWTLEQVANLNAYQASGYVHPYTCGRDDCRADLVAESDGWHCPKCDYRQNSAHTFSASPEWRGQTRRLAELMQEDSDA